jgi:imidazolonepropionase-like amidohydrolase
MLQAITGGLIIDGTGNEPIPNGILLVEDGTIKSVGTQKDIPVPAEAELTDFGNSSLLPGLIDTHVHLVLNMQPDCVSSLGQKTPVQSVLEAAHNARRALHGGVTTVRDCADVHYVTLALKQEIEAGRIEGARIVACGLPITTTAGHLNTMGIRADSTDEVLKSVRTLVAKGVDWIKVCATGGGLTTDSNVRRAQYSSDTLTALVSDAHRLGRKVAAHAHGSEGIENCAISGTDSIEHCSWLGQVDGYDYNEQAVEMIKKKGLYVSHTIAGPRTGSPEEIEDILQSDMGERYGHLRRTLEQGVRMVISSDAGIPGCRFEDFPGSLVIAVKCCGFSPMAAIIAATSRAAEMLDLQDRIGSLEVGKYADMIVVDGNPLESIDSLRNIIGVFKEGRKIV